MEAKRRGRPQQVVHYRVGGENWGVELEERRRGEGLQAGVSVCIQRMLSGVADWDKTLSGGEK